MIVGLECGEIEAMPERTIRKAVEELRAEISKLPEQDSEARERLEKLILEVETGLESEGDEYESLIEELNGTVEKFEVEHPVATTLLSRIVQALSNMGI